MRWLSTAILFLVSASTFATPLTEQIEIQSDGMTWSRHILTEPRNDGRQLLLVVDVPSNPTYMSKITYRKSFAPHEIGTMARIAGEFRKLASPPRLDPGLKITDGGVWTITHSWTAADEDDYSKWIAENAKPDMLQNSGIIVDCADFGMTLRWIYAHDHHLPAGDQMTADQKLIGGWSGSADWDKLATNDDWKKDDRFKKALMYVLAGTFTHSLLTDSYPVAITPELVRPGTIYLTLYMDSGHTRTIYNIGENENCPGQTCIGSIWGNEPSSDQGWTDAVAPQWQAKGDGGFLMWRWPEQVNGIWQLRDPQKMPGFNEEQFTWGEMEYLNSVSARLGLWNTPSDKYVALGSIAVTSVSQRLVVAALGYFQCSLIPCAPTDPLYSTFSTPQRDHRLQAGIANFKAAAKEVDPNDFDVASFNDKQSRPLMNGLSITVLDMLTGDYAPKFSGDPTVDIFVRWGIQNVDAGSRLQALAQVATWNWSYRDGLVEQAQKLCFPNGEATPTCDPKDPQVIAASTVRLDQAFHVFQASFVKDFNAAAGDVKSAVQNYLEQQTTEAHLCDNPWHDNSCTMYDFLIGSPQHLAAMSSDPTAPLKARYGY